MELPKLPKYDPPEMDMTIFDSIAETKEQKDRRDSFRFWLTIAIMIIGLVIAVMQVYQQYSMSNIKEQVQINSNNIQKLSNDLNDLDHRVTSFDSTLVRTVKKIDDLNNEKTYKLNPKKTVTQK